MKHYKASGVLNEHTEQAKVITWAKWKELEYPALKYLHAIPNGGWRDVRVARKLKAEGVKPGVPDLFLPYPNRGAHGLYVEMKALDGKPSPEQLEFLEWAESVGYMCAICYGAEEAQKAIEDYLKTPAP